MRTQQCWMENSQHCYCSAPQGISRLSSLRAVACETSPGAHKWAVFILTQARDVSQVSELNHQAAKAWNPHCRGWCKSRKLGQNVELWQSLPKSGIFLYILLTRKRHTLLCIGTFVFITWMNGLATVQVFSVNDLLVMVLGMTDRYCLGSEYPAS